MDNLSYPVSIIAKLLDLTERRVQQLAQEGVILKNNKGIYPLLPCVQGYIKYLRDKSIGKNTSTNDAYAERARLLKNQADKLELEVGLLKKNILYSDEVEAGWSNLIARCRAVLLAIPNRLALQVTSLQPKEAEGLKKMLFMRHY